MKTKLHFSTIQNCKNGILSLLIIFFMTVYSFGQTIVINIDCLVEEDSIFTSIATFEFTDQVNGVYSGEAVFPTGGRQPGYTLFLQTDDTWVMNDPTGVRWFYTTDSPSAPSPCSANWIIETQAGGGVVPCDTINFITCNTATPEICDGIDNDGDGDIDEDLDFTTYYKDNDGDGFGDENISISTCDGAPAGYVANSLDCYDEDGINYDDDPTVYPGAPEICDGLDNNCDGQIDEGIDDCIDGVIVDYCDDQNKKILICHNGKTKCVSINAMDAHLAHGDYLGTCGSSKEGDVDIAEEVPTSYDVVSWPNPTRDSFNIRMSTPNTIDKVSLKAFDINGRLIHSNLINGNEDYQFGSQLSSGVYFVRLSQANTIKVIKVIKQ